MTDYLYIASRNSSGNEALRYWNGALSADGNLSPRYFIGPWQTRWVQAHMTDATKGPGGANGNASTVWFSVPLTPGTLPHTSFTDTTAYLQLDPLDGEEITGVCTWRELLFVSKRSHIYVFYSVSTGADGSPVFNYNRVTMPSRLRATTNLGGECMIAGGDGVYLLAGDGVYRTTGGTPELVSQDVGPLFDGTGPSTITFPSSGDWSIGYALNRFYLSYNNSSSYLTLVYDTLVRQWLLWDISVGGAAVPTNVIEWGDSTGKPTGWVASGAKVWAFTKTATSDDGTSITSRYQTGWADLGTPDEKYIRGAVLIGTGSPTISVLADYATSDSSAAAVTLGTAPTPNKGFHLPSYVARRFAVKVNATSAWTLDAVDLNQYG